VYVLKEWGVPLDDADDSIFLLDNLPEFESTDLEYLPCFASGCAPAQPIHASRDEINWNPRADDLPLDVDRSSEGMLPPGQRPTKRRRLNNDFLHDLIPHVRIIFIHLTCPKLLTSAKCDKAPLSSLSLRRPLPIIRYPSCYGLLQISAYPNPTL
jgi:hypothetical protein